MCGIFAVFNSKLKPIEMLEYFEAIKHRGPDYSVLKPINDKAVLGFHRLSIVDPTPKSNQPLFNDGVWLICNGEIFNHKILEMRFDFTKNLTTGSDCEVILHLYNFYRRTNNAIDSMHQVLIELEGEFSFILYDEKYEDVFVARDPFGVRPLFWSKSLYEDEHSFYFASELKAIDFRDEVSPFPPAHVMYFKLQKYIPHYYLSKYYEFPEIKLNENTNLEGMQYHINRLLKKSVHKRLMSDRPVGCFLSGGLDSSLVTAIVSKHLPDIHCFSIGLDEGVDIQAAKKVIDYLEIPKEKHHIVNFTIEEGFSVIERVIYHLESYDITTIRASIPQFLLSKYIAENTDIKVLYSGGGADELFAGYQYSKMAPSPEELEKDTRRLLEELYMFDNLRVDRTTAAHGLEVRIPFLDPELVDYVMKIPAKHKMCPHGSGIIEKSLLRNSFKKEKLLPDEILFRPKEAFSDGISSKEKSWYKSLVESYIEPLISDDEMKEINNPSPATINFDYITNIPKTKEALYYRRIFDSLFPEKEDVIKHLWMPKWVGDIDDPSATVLDCYTTF